MFFVPTFTQFANNHPFAFRGMYKFFQKIISHLPLNYSCLCGYWKGTAGLRCGVILSDTGYHKSDIPILSNQFPGGHSRQICKGCPPIPEPGYVSWAWQVPLCGGQFFVDYGRLSSRSTNTSTIGPGYFGWPSSVKGLIMRKVK
jgi:hypothetical protein